MVLYEQDRFGNILPVGLFSRLTFRWINNTLKHGNRSRIQEKDIPDLRKNDSAELLVQVFEKNWQDEEHLARLIPDRKWPLLLRVLVKSFCFHLSILFVLKLLDLLFRVSIIVLLGVLIGQLQSPSNQAYIYAGLLGGVTLLYVLLRSFHVYSLEERGIQIKTSVVGLIYRKVQRLNQKSLHDVTSCHVTRLVSIECEKIQASSFFIHHLAIFPLEVLIITALSWQHITWLSMIATCFVLGLIPLQIVIGRFISKLRYELTQLCNKRMSLMERIIKGIKIMKFNVWESPLASLVDDIRRSELKFLRRNILIFSFQQMLQFCCLTMISCIVFPTMMFLDKPFTAEKVFSTLALYSCLFNSVLFVSRGLVRIPETLAAMQQIEQFMEMDEMRPKEGVLCRVVGNSMFFVNAGFDRLQEYTKPSFPTTVLGFERLTNQCPSITTIIENNPPRVWFKNACFNWKMNKQTPVLSDISLDLDDKCLLCVTGAPDTGKTALLLATLEEIPLVDGQFVNTGRTVYVPQVPWVFTGTLRDNILFNSPYAEDRYWRVIYTCALDKDIGEFPNGDLTLLENGGAALTTDQRIRISLARAAYCEADVYLIDDCLGLLDDRTREHLVKRVLTGLLSNTSRVVVTSNHDIMEHCSHVLIMENGRIKQQGTYQNVKELIDTLETTERTENKLESFNNRIHEIRQHSRRISTSCSDVILDDSIAKFEDDLPVGVSSWSVCWKYLKTGRNVLLLILLGLLMVTGQGMLVVTDWWLAEWSNKDPKSQANRNKAYIFYGCVLVAIMLALLRSLGCFLTLLKTSRTLHKNMVTAVLKAQVSFFASNPLERILQRFSKDTYNIDNLLPYGISESIQTIIHSASVVIMCCVFNYWVPLVGVPVVALSVCLRRYALRSIKDLKKLEQSYRHDMLIHCSTTLKGLTCIRAFNTQQCFLHKFIRLLDNHTRSSMLFNAGIRWLCLRMELLCGVFVLGVSVAAVVAETSAGYAGMSLFYAVQLLAGIEWTIIITTETETIMSSYARILGYGTLEPEPGYVIQPLPPQDWPQGGGIKCENLFYDSEPQENLKLMNLDILPGEKVAVVGQKDSGKSSLIHALFQLPQPNGQVFIDGTNISKVALQNSRRIFGFIPERPHLLSTSLRFNLDPWQQFSNPALWSVLEKLQLKAKVINQFDTSLDASIAGFTPNELKLVDFGRALLEDKKILICMENDTNPDWSLIQDIISTHFQDRTVIIFANSLDTIMGSEKVLVMRGGCLVEFNTPENLCRQDDNHLMDVLQYSINTQPL